MIKKLKLKEQLAAELLRGKTIPVFEEKEDDDEENIPEFQATKQSLEPTVEMFKSILNNAETKQCVDQMHSVILTGPPGTGKTQRLGLFAKLVGLELITIEVPHIIEEHMVNIPFIITRPDSSNEISGHTTVEDGYTRDHDGNWRPGEEYRIELADSNLFSKITEEKKQTDAQYLEYLKTADENVKELFIAMGGNIETGKIPYRIKKFRDAYEVIIFIDEFLRQTSLRIRNILRGILNNQIGRHKIPKSTLLVYATNLKRHENEGIDEIPMYYSFAQIQIEPQTEDEWFSWLVTKFKNDEHGVVLNPAIINRFHKLLKERNYFKNRDGNIRTSPRRWEQILLYINASLPVDNAKDAKNLLSNIKVNFKDYMTGEHAHVVDDVLEATAKLIKQTSGITVDPKDVNDSSTEWMDTLEHQIQVRKKTGMQKHRTYIPVISGQPGIAKTAEASNIAVRNNLRFILIDISTLFPEDIQGILLAQHQENGKLKTVFSAPVLYQRIMEDIHTLDREYFETIKKDNPDTYRKIIANYKKQNVKYLVFFDELNRNSPKFFNRIRRVLLEKNFGPGQEPGSILKLPDEAMLMAAINPHDTGTQELTKDAQDVLDIIDGPSK